MSQNFTRISSLHDELAGQTPGWRDVVGFCVGDLLLGEFSRNFQYGFFFLGQVHAHRLFVFQHGDLYGTGAALAVLTFEIKWNFIYLSNLEQRTAIAGNGIERDVFLQFG